MLKIAVCDDNLSCLDLIKSFFNELDIELEFEVSYFNNGKSLLDTCKKVGGFQILFIDIEMPKISGLMCVDTINKDYPKTIVIFTTSHASYISDTFRLNTFQFLLKPIDKTLFLKELDRALMQHKNLCTILYLNNADQTLAVEYGDIVYIDVYAKRVTVHTANDTITVQGRLQDFYEKLEQHNFAYCNKSMIVNLANVKMINKDMVILKHCYDKIYTTRNYKNILLQKYRSFLLRSSI